MPQLYRQELVPDVIVMDPVRAGCSEEVLKAAAGMNPKRIVYVSCNPATFARDAKILKSEGYEIKKSSRWTCSPDHACGDSGIADTRK